MEKPCTNKVILSYLILLSSYKGVPPTPGPSTTPFRFSVCIPRARLYILQAYELDELKTKHTW